MKNNQSLQNVKRSAAFLKAFSELCRAEYLKPGGVDSDPIVIYRMKSVDGLAIEQGTTRLIIECGVYNPEVDWREVAAGDDWHIVVFTTADLDADVKDCAAHVFDMLGGRA